MAVESYRNLVVWQKSMQLVKLVYRFSQTFPKSELYGLTSQMRRCAVSIPSNIAEGSRRGTSKDFRQFLFIAFGSGAELETQLEIVKDLGFIDSKDIEPIASLLEEVMKMLNKLTKTIV